MAKKATPKNQAIQILNSQITVQKLERYQIQIDSWRSALQSAENIHNPVRKRLYEIYNEILLDAHLSAIISKRIRNVKNKKIVFVEKDGKINEQTNELFEAPFFRDLIEYIMETIFWGHTLVEFEFFNKMIDKVHLVPRQHVRPELGIIGLTSPYDTEGINYREEPYNKFTLEIAKKDLGLLNIAAANAIFKKYGKVDFANFVEMFGSPTRKFTYDYMNLTAQSEANKVAQESGNSASIVMPKDLVDLELVASSSTNSTVHLDFSNDLKSELSVLILGQTMTTENGSSRSQAEVHQAQQDDIAFDDMQFVEYVLNWDLKEKLIAFGYPLKNGKFKFDTSENLSTKEQIEIDLQLKNLVDIDPNYFYEKYNLPKPKESKEQKTEEKELAAERTSSHQKKKSLNSELDFCCRNSDTENELEFDIDLGTFIKEVFEAKLKKGFISKAVFNIYNEILQAAISEGYENIPDSDKSFFNELSYNQSVFAAFKTHKIGDDLAKLLIDENGKLRTFSQFQKVANPLLDNYNQNWLRAEYNTSVSSAQAAKKWQEIQRDKDLFPYLEFRTQGDAAVRSEHRKLNGIIRKVEDSFWNTHYPPLGFNCRCSVRKLEEGTETKLPKDLPQPKEGFSENVGKTAKVFDDTKHGYSKDLTTKQKENIKKQVGLSSKEGNNDNKKPFEAKQLKLDGKNLNEAEQYIKNKKEEFAYIYDKNGKQLYIFEGDASTVPISDKKIKEITTKHKNLVFTHNHPTPDFFPYFSIGDIVAASNYNMAEIRVVYKDGVGFSALRKNNIWTDQKDNEKYLNDLFADLFDEAIEEQPASQAYKTALENLLKLLQIEVTQFKL